MTYHIQMPCLGKGGGKAVKKPQNQLRGSGPLLVIQQGYGNILYMYVLPE